MIESPNYVADCLNENEKALLQEHLRQLSYIDVSPELEQRRFGWMDRDETPERIENHCSNAVLPRIHEKLEKRLDGAGIPQSAECLLHAWRNAPVLTRQQTEQRLDGAGVAQLAECLHGAPLNQDVPPQQTE
jgi:hypothetical protein